MANIIFGVCAIGKLMLMMYRYSFRTMQIYASAIILHLQSACAHQKQITLDLMRTMPNNVHFSSPSQKGVSLECMCSNALISECIYQCTYQPYHYTNHLQIQSHFLSDCPDASCPASYLHSQSTHWLLSRHEFCHCYLLTVLESRR